MKKMALGSYARTTLSLAKKVLPVLSGRDYFHLRQGLGKYFQDHRCYYNDLGGKADWRGKYIDDVPALYIPAWRKDVLFPIMIIQYGLGHLDRLFLTADPASRAAIGHVTRWLVAHVNERGHYDNLFPEILPTWPFHSNNSGMAQGEALSFLIRVADNQLVEGDLLANLPSLIARIADNMLLPVENHGTAVRAGGGLYFCEFCRSDEYVVLNGWIYGIFGMMDYARWSNSAVARDALHETVTTLKRDIHHYTLPDGWSYYDNKKRLCTPFYQGLHVHLIQAMALLTEDEELAKVARVLDRACTPAKKAKYFLVGSWKRLRDPIPQTQSQKPTQNSQ